MLQIGGIQKTTLIDYPGRVAATIFLCGCNFRCPFCYSSELVLQKKIILQPKISEKELFGFLKKRKRLLEGVVICGGEPTINKELPDFVKKIKDFGFLVKLDTNGSNPGMLKKLIDLKMIDYVAMDIKAPFGKKYKQATGAKINLNDIKKSVGIIKGSGIDYEFRSTIVPGIHTKEDIIQIAKDIGPARKFFLQNFRPEKTINSDLEAVRPYPKDFLLEVKKVIKGFFEICEVRY
ncbi:MAG: anaerobic ribonucleoside-triphosphate reductase activating protein [bacterium]|nr:anaerobic ribonucleoside-triphosphate reductase activating protein [bacterium]